MALKRSLLVGLAVLLVSAPAADARSAFHKIGDGPVWADGERYAAVGGGGWTGKPSRIIDDVTRRSWTLAPPRNDCGVAGAAAGYVLWDCSVPEYTPLLQSLETGAVSQAPGWDAFVSWLDFPVRRDDRPYVSGFGARWLRATYWCYHCGPQFSFVDWHSGAFRGLLPDLARHSYDVDLPELDRRICAPLSRRAVEGEGRFEVEFAPEDYEPPWLLRDAASTSDRLGLYHCGRRKPVAIPRCRFGGCLSRRLGGG